MKKNTYFIIAGVLLTSSTLVGCGKDKKSRTLTFEKDTYEITSGEAVTVKEDIKGVSYEIKGKQIEGVSVDSNTGVFTFDNTIPNYSQVMYIAKCGDLVSEPTVVTLTWAYSTPRLSWFGNITSIADGGYIIAETDNGLSVNYELTDFAKGVSIDFATGRVEITSLAEEGEEFTVRASSYGQSITKTFKVAKENLVESLTPGQCCEVSNPNGVSYKLDFSKLPSGFSKEVIGISNGNKMLSGSYFSFDDNTDTVFLDASIFDTLVVGETKLGIVTSRNTVYVSIIKASKFLKSGEDIAAINNDKNSLSGYYVLANDIDLTDYINETSNKSGWMPIGIYHDTTDGTALVDSFAGTFDGNGHVISGLRMNRTDEFGFNAGFFGYVNASASIKNLGIIMDQTKQSTVYSYAGGFVGVNNGIIENCWINYNLKQDNEANRVCGGFAGRNFNTIKHCFAYGTIGSGTEVGAFLGQNGEVGVSGLLVDCYATGGTSFMGSGNLDGCTYGYFNSLQDLKTADFSGFSNEFWTLTTNELPSLKSNIEFNYPFQIKFANEKEHFNVGEIIDLGVIIKPETFEDQYKNNVEITCDDENTQIINGKATITSASASKIRFTAKLSLETGSLQDSIEIYTHPVLISASIVDDLPAKLEPGKRYRLNHTIQPENAYDDAKWSLYPNTIKGVQLNDNILSITEDIKDLTGSTITVRLTVQGNTYQKTYSLLKYNYLTEKKYVYSDTEETEFYLELPSELDLTDMIVYRYSKVMTYRLDGNKVYMPISALSICPNAEMAFTFRLKDGSVYKGYAMYVVKKTYDPADVPADAIELSSVDDFAKYFNIKNYNASRYTNYYNKNFVLTQDIDFGNQTIYGIGDSDHPFTGHIYGQGHTLKNININESEKYFLLEPAKQTDNYRSSKYNVGFFGAFGGVIQDLTFQDLHVSANNYVGTLAGKIIKGGLVQNVAFVDCSCRNSSGTDYSHDEYVSGKIAASNAGTLDGVTYNGEPIME